MVEQLTPSTKRPYSDVSDSDSEWEYEYSTTETESFYVTLDLSSHSNATLHHPSKRRFKHKTKTGIPANDRPRPPITIDNVEVTAPATEPPTNQPNSPAQEQPPSPTPDEGPERIQILDLHGDNPLISYQGAIYSCTWSEPLGTDVLLTAPPDRTSNMAADGEKPSPILAWSRLRLVAKPVKLIPHEQEKRSRKEDFLADGTRIPGTEPAPSRPTNLQEHLPSPEQSSRADAQPAAARGSIAAPEQSNPTADPDAHRTPPPPPPPQPITSPTPHLSPSPPPIIALPSHASHNRTTQASFLTSLITAKRARGETDTVTLHAPKPQGSGWRAQKKAKERAAKKREEKKGREEKRRDEGMGVGVGVGVGTLVEEGGAGMRGRGRGRPRGRGGRGGRGGGSGDTLGEEEPAVTDPNNSMADAGGGPTTGAEEAQAALASAALRLGGADS